MFKLNDGKMLLLVGCSGDQVIALAHHCYLNSVCISVNVRESYQYSKYFFARIAEELAVSVRIGLKNTPPCGRGTVESSDTHVFNGLPATKVSFENLEIIRFTRWLTVENIKPIDGDESEAFISSFRKILRLPGHTSFCIKTGGFPRFKW